VKYSAIFFDLPLNINRAISLVSVVHSCCVL